MLFTSLSVYISCTYHIGSYQLQVKCCVANKDIKCCWRVSTSCLRPPLEEVGLAFAFLFGTVGGGGALSAAMLAAYVATAALAFPAGADLDLDGGGGGGPPAFAVAADGGGGGIPAIALQSETS